MSAVHAILLLVVVQRLAELIYARRNTRRLIARGGIVVTGCDHDDVRALAMGGQK